MNQRDEQGRFLEGNSFSNGNGGRPPIFRTQEEFATKVNEYFDSLILKDSEGNITGELPATITGAALFLGFSSKQSLYDYKEKPEFSYPVGRLRLAVEHGYELRLHTNNATGAIFALKNTGWTDRREITGSEGQPLLDANWLPQNFAINILDESTEESK